MVSDFLVWAGCVGKRVSSSGLAGVFPGEEAVLDVTEGLEIEEAALRTAWHGFEATGLQPAVLDGVIGDLAS
jgi:hypothetical protein